MTVQSQALKHSKEWLAEEVVSLRAEVERLRAELAELQRSYDFMSGEAHKREQAEARLAKVVKAADDAYKYLYSPGFGPDTPKLPLVKVMANLEAALAAAKGGE